MQDVNLQRVKVYRLNQEGSWDDHGTGQVSVEILEQSESIGLVVVSEEDARTLLVHRIVKEDIYQKQPDDTIILWKDPEIETDIALSFQEITGCNDIWDQIQQVQRHPTHRQPGSPGRRRVVDEFEQAAMLGEFESGPSRPVDLPPAELANLSEIAKILNEVSFLQKEALATQLLRSSYVRKILDIFRTCEDLEDRESLTHLYHVVKGMIMLGETNLLEVLLGEENVMDVVGALEYEPGVAQQPKHREFLREHVVFKEVVPIKDPQVKARIHSTYQMGYVKDVVLPRVLDDQTFAALLSLMLFYNHDVLMALQSDANFFQDLFKRLRSCGPGDEEWRDLVCFLQELCSQAKHLQPAHRAQLMSRLVGLGLFEITAQVLKHGDEQLQYKATDVLLSSVHHDPCLLRNYLTKDGKELFAVLMGQLLNHKESGLQDQTLEMLRILLDPETLETTIEHDPFMDAFYKIHIFRLMSALTSSTCPTADQEAHTATAVQGPQSPEKASGGPNSSSAEAPTGPVAANTLGLIVELLCFCVQNHGYRVKYFILGNNLVEKVLRLLRRRERWLVVAAVRFLRAVISLKDEFYNKSIIRHNLLEPLFAVFLQNGDRYNLLNSAVLELVEFVWKENVKGLVANIMENFYPRLEHIDYVETFTKLKSKYDQNMEREKMGGAASGAAPGGGDAAGDAAAPLPRRRREEREMDRDEESYFERDDDQDQAQEAPSPAVAANAKGEDAPGASDGSFGDAARSSQANGEVCGTPGPSPPPKPTSRLVDYDCDDDDDDFPASKPKSERQPPHPTPSASKRARTDSPEAASRPAGSFSMTFKSGGAVLLRRTK